MSENVCTACGGSGQQWSGVEYMGTHEIVGCDECWGTGFEDVAAGVDDLRAQLAQREGELEALRTALRGLYDSLPRYSCKSDAPDGCPVCMARAALSDNPESPSLTDKEEDE